MLGTPIDHALLFEPFVVAAARAGRDLASAGGGAASHYLLRFVLGAVVGSLVWFARPRLGRRVGSALLLGFLLWLLAYPALVMQHELFGVLPAATARKVLGFGLLQMTLAALAATFASRDVAPAAPPPPLDTSSSPR
ncbi:MAG: hypothetical protein JNL90_00720 [Planctomycetes bacterium]|nr:hypothetical protein [Planctomycetota bacterium]